MGEDAASFAGFTSAMTNGQIPDGRPGAHARCAQEFPGSHLCHASEYVLANAMGAIPADGAWLDPSVNITGGGVTDGSPTFGRHITNSCNNWSTTAPSYSAVIVRGGGEINSVNDCGRARPLACCTGASRVRFAGFTSASTVAAGGRPSMHARCNAELPGSHMCHAAEFVRANGTVPVPAGGAWLDPSTTPTGHGTSDGLPGAARSIYSSCQSWTTTAPSYSAVAVQPGGGIFSTNSCGTPRPIACCL